MLCSGGDTQRYQSKNCYSDLTVSPHRDRSGPHCGPSLGARSNGRCHKSGSATLEAVTQLPKNATNDFRQISFLANRVCLSARSYPCCSAFLVLPTYL